MAMEAESLLESHWTDHINKTHLQQNQYPYSYSNLPYCVMGDNFDKAFTTLRSYPYYQRYVDLTNMELSAIRFLLPAKQRLRKVAVIGCGALPLTSVCLVQHIREQDARSRSLNDLEILNIDSCPRAIAQSSTLARALGRYGSCLRFVQENVIDFRRDFSLYDVVFVVKLDGDKQDQKEAALPKIVQKMRSGCLIVIRTSHGLRSLLYPEFEVSTEKVTERVGIEVVMHPWRCGGATKSVIIGRVR